ncbi:MAG: multicopper oxidase domain-containing protein [Acidobacteriota bacterium]|nr:multicopper oxidase domain-containing protein [Acidobacteriota bacterium]
MKRRDFLKASAAAGALFVTKKRASAQTSPTLTPFVDPLPVPPVLPSSNSYTVTMNQITQKLHRDLPATPLWGYNGTYLGPTFEARKGLPISVLWENKLPSVHLFDSVIDPTIHGSEAGQPHVRTVVHLHGHKVLPPSDGHPDAWFTRDFARTGNPPFPITRVYHYPNDQRGTMLWYHDHALGSTRLNICAGLAGVYFLRDEVEDGLNIPGGQFEVPLVLQDRLFNADGSIFFTTNGGASQTHPLWNPEYFGDTGLVNGKIWPYLRVQPRKYRFRILNASNARFWQLHLTTRRGQTVPMVQIGSDQGFLPHPITQQTILVGLAERFDVIVDFSPFANQTITMTTDAPDPFPGGGGVVLTGGNVMQFRVAEEVEDPDHTVIPSSIQTYAPIDPHSASVVRDIPLIELDDSGNFPIIDMLEGKHWDEPVSVKPKVGATEIWRFINTTPDAHPIHVHLTHFFILDRQPFDVATYNSTGHVVFTGPVEPPAPEEVNAPKDVVKVFPGKVTRIIQKFDLPSGTASSPGQVFPYVFHCHILDHEDNEMMRPYNVIG